MIQSVVIVFSVSGAEITNSIKLVNKPEMNVIDIYNMQLSTFGRLVSKMYVFR